MADVMLKDSSGADRTYPGIDTVSLPTADGGVATFTLGGSGGLGVQADLQQTDSSADDFVKGQYFGYLPDIVPEVTVEFTESEGLFNGPLYSTSDFKYNKPLVVGTSYKVTWNGTTRTLIAKSINNAYDSGVTINGVFLGNFGLMYPIQDSANDASTASFLFVYSSDEDTYAMYTSTSESKANTFKITLESNRKKLSTWWLDDEVATRGYADSIIPKPDLQQTAPNSKDYVKGQYFGLLPDNVPQTYKAFLINDVLGCYQATSYDYTSPIIEGCKYRVRWHNDEYVVTAKLFNDEGLNSLDDMFRNSVTLGNTNIVATNKVDGLEEASMPFMFMSVLDGAASIFLTSDTAATHHTFRISPADNKKKLDMEWISDEVATKSFVEEAIANIEGPGGSVPSVGEVDILSEGDFNFEPIDDIVYRFQTRVSLSATSFIVGESYNVVFDSDTYEGITAKSFVFPGENLIYLYLGNASLLDSSFENTQEKFVCGIIVADGVAMDAAIATLESGTSHKIRIYQEKESVTIIEKDVFAEQTVSGFVFDDTYQSYSKEPILAPFTLTEGESYYVEWDGIKHLCVADTTVSPLTGTDITFIGNGVYVGKNGNGENFLIAYDSTYGAIQFFSLTSTESHAVRIYQTEVVLNKPDWNENNPDSPNYIANRPFYIGEPESTTLMPETSVPFEYDGSIYVCQMTPSTEILTAWLQDWSKATVIWDGTEYVCEPQYVQGIKCIGNVGLMMGTADTGEPFILMMADASSMFGADICMAYSVADSTTNILPSQSLTFEAVEGASYYSATIDTLSLTEGETYCISCGGNGQEPCTAFSYTSGDTMYIGFGNASLMGLGDDTGVAFFAYTATASDGTQSSAILYVTATTMDVQIDYTPTVVHNTSLSLFLQKIVTLDSKFLGEVPWSKITNKPFGVTPAGTALYDGTISCTTNMGAVYAAMIDEIEIITDVTYTITLDGISYECVGFTADGMTGISYDEEDAFFMIVNGYTAGQTVIAYTQGDHTLTIIQAEDYVKKIDPIYLPDTLPEITSEDDGKVLTVEAGAWVVKEPVKGVPEVTTEDNGKFLRVIDGMWTATTVQNVEEVSF